jgi:hypothetical protein
MASHCTSWGMLGDGSGVGARFESLLPCFLRGGLGAWGRVEPLVLVVGLVADEDAGGGPVLDGGGCTPRWAAISAR